MKYYIQYVTDCIMNLKSFHSEKARNTFERDFHRKHQFQEEYYVDMIFEGDVTFVSDGFVVDADEFDSREKHVEAHKEATSEVPVGEFKVGDKVRLKQFDYPSKDTFDLGEVLNIAMVDINDDTIYVHSEDEDGVNDYWVSMDNVELVNE